MGIGPVPAVAKAFARAGLSFADMALIELNEAFAAQVLAVLREWDLPDGLERVNVQRLRDLARPPDRRDRRADHDDAAARARAVAVVATAWRRCASVAARASPPSSRTRRHQVTDETSAMTNPEYDIHLDDKYGSLTVIDIPAEIAAHEPWFNQTLTTVNDAVVRLGLLEGDFHWHKHDADDEFFLVLDGQLLIDLQDRDTIVLGPHQGYTVPRGILHRTRAPQRTAILMVEPAGVAPTGD